MKATEFEFSYNSRVISWAEDFERDMVYNYLDDPLPYAHDSLFVFHDPLIL